MRAQMMCLHSVLQAIAAAAAAGRMSSAAAVSPQTKTLEETISLRLGRAAADRMQQNTVNILMHALLKNKYTRVHALIQQQCKLTNPKP